MNTETETIELEVVAPEADPKLVQYAAQTGLEKQSTETLVEAFRPIFAKSREALANAKGVAESVKDATCVREIMRSRACRLKLRKVRLESDEARKKHKQHALLYGRAVDGFHNILLADLTPVETALQEAEDIAERAEAKRLADVKAAREAELVPLLDEPLLGNLADLSEADYMKKLNNAKLLRQAKVDAAAKVETDRKAKEEADRIERERIAAENARLKAEVEAREAAYKAEREATRQAVEKKLTEERAEAARLAKESKAKADEAHRRELEEQAKRVKIELAAIEARGKAEAIAREAAVRVERAEQVAAFQRAMDKRDQERAEIEAKARRHAEDSAAARAQLVGKEKAEAAEMARFNAEREAAADGVKLKRFAYELRALPKPTLKDASVQSDLAARVEKVAAWAEEVLL